MPRVKLESKFDYTDSLAASDDQDDALSDSYVISLPSSRLTNSEDAYK